MFRRRLSVLVFAGLLGSFLVCVGSAAAGGLPHFFRWGASSTGLPPYQAVWAMDQDSALTGTLYAETRDGAFKSVDFGETWQKIRSVSWASFSYGLDIVVAGHDPDTVYVAVPGKGGVIVSHDGGATWAAMNAGIERYGFDASPYVNRIAIAHTAPYTVYAGLSDRSTYYGGGVFRSANGGESWSLSGLIDEIVQAIEIDPASPNHILVGAERGLFESKDGGNTWAGPAQDLGSVSDIAFDPSDPRVVYAAYWDKGVYKSVDGGATWRATATWRDDRLSRAITDLMIDPRVPQAVYAATEKGICVSYDGGQDWLDTAAPPVDYQVIVADPRGNGLLAGIASNHGESVYGVHRGVALAQFQFLPLSLGR